MRKMKKMSKFVAVLLVFAMAFTVLPYNFGSVLAASSATEETIVDTVEEAVILSEIVFGYNRNHRKPNYNCPNRL